MEFEGRRKGVRSKGGGCAKEGSVSGGGREWRSEWEERRECDGRRSVGGGVSMREEGV